ncbi:hypothetical protein HYT56_02675, partial [Candidatus Woesearchaeota archaeon]|nr:hypothetical protein [Candidatus Woesearchaeota archaeon]
QKPMQALLDTKQSLQEIDDAYKWLMDIDAYILRVNQKPKQVDERLAWFCAYSGRACLNCGRYPQGSDASLGVKFYPQGAL